jgi:hypothetical protein
MWLNKEVYSWHIKAEKRCTMSRNPAAIFTTILLMCAIPAPADAHDFWSNGDKVPAWVKAECCGPQDVHHLRPGAVHIEQDGYHIDGIKTVVPIARALPSPDGDYWAFWNPAGEPEPAIFCFFAPLNGASSHHHTTVKLALDGSR